MNNKLKTLAVIIFAIVVAACSKTPNATSASSIEDAKRIAAKAAMADLRAKTSEPETSWALCPASPTSQVLTVNASGITGRALMVSTDGGAGQKWEITQGAAEKSYSQINCRPFSKTAMNKLLNG